MADNNVLDASGAEWLSSQVKPGTSGKDLIDGWTNLITGLGQWGSDKRQGALFQLDVYAYIQCRDMWDGDDLAARIIEVIPDEMLRQGFEIHIDSDKNPGDTDSLEEKLQQKLQEIDAIEKIRKAMYYSRAYGGGCILLGADDGQENLSLPLDLKRIKSLDFLTPLDPLDIWAVNWNEDPNSLNFGLPESWILRNGQQIHTSRVLVFQGHIVNRFIPRYNRGFGRSIFYRVGRVLRDFSSAWEAAGLLMTDFGTPVFKVKDLGEMLSSSNESQVLARIKTMEMARSVAHTTLIDADENYERQATNLAGFPELLKEFQFRLAAACKMPVSLLMGQTPSGLNASGDVDIRFFYDNLKVEQIRLLKPHLETLVEILLAIEHVEAPNWKIVFSPLWQERETDIVQTRNQQALTDQIYLQTGVLTPEEVRNSRFGGSDYSIHTTLEENVSPKKPVTSEKKPVTNPQTPVLDPLRSRQSQGPNKQGIDPSVDLPQSE